MRYVRLFGSWSLTTGRMAGYYVIAVFLAAVQALDRLMLDFSEARVAYRKALEDFHSAK